MVSCLCLSAGRAYSLHGPCNQKGHGTWHLMNGLLEMMPVGEEACKKRQSAKRNGRVCVRAAVSCGRCAVRESLAVVLPCCPAALLPYHGGNFRSTLFFFFLSWVGPCFRAREFEDRTLSPVQNVMSIFWGSWFIMSLLLHTLAG